MKASGEKWTGKTVVVPHPMYEGRRTPVKQLVRRLGLASYDNHAAFVPEVTAPKRVSLPLSQHVGAPAVPVVKPGQHVRCGDCVADIREGALGARIHASIDGIVRSVDGSIVIEQG